jgi:hypothetical protein
MRKTFAPAVLGIIAAAGITACKFPSTSGDHRSGSDGVREHKSEFDLTTITDVTNNPKCPSGFETFKVEAENLKIGVNNFTITVGGTSYQLTVTLLDRKVWDWSSTLAMDIAISKGGDGARIYTYDPEIFSGQGLVSPNNGGGQVPDISHVQFCYDDGNPPPTPTPTPTATPTPTPPPPTPAPGKLAAALTTQPSLTRTHKWTIEKKALNSGVTVTQGSPVTLEYDVNMAYKGFAETGLKIAGQIVIVNGSADYEAIITGVSGTSTPGNNPLVITCPTVNSPQFPLAKGATLTCDYSVMNPTQGTGTISITVTTGTPNVTGTTASASYNTASAPFTDVDNCVLVSDPVVGTMPLLCAPDSKTFHYTNTVAANALNCGQQSISNTATYNAVGSTTTASSTANATINVVCPTPTPTPTPTATPTLPPFVNPKLTGSKYEDLNGNNRRDAGEPGLAGWKIFIDKNGNNILDAGEPFAVTNATGVYTMTLGPGTYNIRESKNPNYVKMTLDPAPITTVSGKDITGVDFGNLEVRRIVAIYPKLLLTGSNYANLINGTTAKQANEIAGWYETLLKRAPEYKWLQEYLRLILVGYKMPQIREMFRQKYGV